MLLGAHCQQPVLRPRHAAGSLLAGLALTADLPAPAAGSTVFVAGSAGKTGREVVNYLTSKGLQVRAGVRVRVLLLAARILCDNPGTAH